MSNVPAIPNIPPLSSIEDPNTRAVLQAIISGQRIRNGEVGDGDEKFLTVADLNGAFQIVRGGGILGTSGGTRPVVAGRVATMLAGLVGDITESRLWKLLGERIQQIDWMQTPEWFNQRFGAAIKTEQLHREAQGQALAGQVTTAIARAERGMAMVKQEVIAQVNENLAESSVITTLQAEYDGQLGLIRDANRVIIDTSGSLLSQVTTMQSFLGDTTVLAENNFTLSQTAESVKGAWTVKFDAGGYVCGVGLGLDSNNDGSYFSNFMVRADRFAIGSPEAPSVEAQVPFVVTATPQVIGGITYPPGVWMNAAFIADATIDTAHIKDLTVDTIKIKNGAVTLTQYASGTLNLTVVGSAWVDVMTMPFTISGLPTGEKAGCLFNTVNSILDGGGDAATIQIGIFVRATYSTPLGESDYLIATTSATVTLSMEASVIGYAALTNENYYVTIRVRAVAPGAVTKPIVAISAMTLMGGKR